jgi:hypothetical protein
MQTQKIKHLSPIMIKPIHLFSWMIISLVLVVSCSKNNDGVVPAPNVYVVGSGDDTLQNSSTKIAKYWKNGKVTHLTDGKNQAEASSIFVEKGNVHIVGYEVDNEIDTRIARYWKNGKTETLSDLGKGSEAYQVLVSNGDVYIGGIVYDEVSKYVYWKNGSVRKDLTDGKGQVVFNNFYAGNSFFVYNNDVYAAGYEYDRATDTGIAKYWKNGVAVTVKDPGTKGFARAYGIFVNKDGVYVAGYEYDKTTKNSTPKYWKITPDSVLPTEVLLPDNRGSISRNNQAKSITVAGSDVYVGGSLDSNPVYWKNGEAALNLTNRQNSVQVLSPVFVFNKDVYVAGYRDFSDNVATYWKNGLSTEIAPGNVDKVDEVAYSIFVTTD